MCGSYRLSQSYVALISLTSLTSTARRRHRRQRRVHPRVCGEHLCQNRTDGVPSGSSPRVRGTLDDRSFDLRVRRFIPACAGNTPTAKPPRFRAAVHPRVCGEHGQGGRMGFKCSGSSPRVRGTLVLHHRPVDVGRFIPACAGNTCGIGCPPAAETVHPRVCGEHLKARVCTAWDCGSSPRVRGTR